MSRPGTALPAQRLRAAADPDLDRGLVVLALWYLHDVPVPIAEQAARRSFTAGATLGRWLAQARLSAVALRHARGEASSDLAAPSLDPSVVGLFSGAAPAPVPPSFTNPPSVSAEM